MKVHPSTRAKWLRWFMSGMGITAIEVREGRPLPVGSVEEAIRVEMRRPRRRRRKVRA